jgi:hypothetical protein
VSIHFLLLEPTAAAELLDPEVEAAALVEPTSPRELGRNVHGTGLILRLVTNNFLVGLGLCEK